MKTLGLIGGTTWVSTIDYYKYINELTIERLGGLNSAKILLCSLQFEPVKAFADVGDWESFGKVFADSARNLEKAGAEAIVLCANTAHIIAERVESAVSIPLIHITDATAREILSQSLRKVALLGTRFTMENDFYHNRLANFGIETVTPNAEERDFIHWSIFEELGKNIFTAETKQKYLEIIENLNNRGAEGVIFGCTEIPMLLTAEDCPVPSFDTTFLHARTAVEFALAD
ncbi:MAG TPA: aspartate/glutamate racemase family protein [Pyrinomonadaceae bacterium]|jgi:aspartate racemase|nr:aspartate/glutamate racemase family protein [Pyrinomonadaceae bacterium]